MEHLDDTHGVTACTALLCFLLISLMCTHTYVEFVEHSSLFSFTKPLPRVPTCLTFPSHHNHVYSLLNATFSGTSFRLLPTSYFNSDSEAK